MWIHHEWCKSSLRKSFGFLIRSVYYAYLLYLLFALWHIMWPFVNRICLSKLGSISDGCQKVELYVDYDPKMLLPFLWRTFNWVRSLRLFHPKMMQISFQAHEICVRRGLFKEQVFILGRMGNAKQALTVIINKLGDIEEVLTLILIYLKEFWSRV